MNRLLDGVRRFRHEIYPSRREVYKEAARRPQRPHTLFITCADSRIDPELITQSGTGEIFVTRNIGNLVPPYGEMLGGVSAVIEYAVAALRVDHVHVRSFRALSRCSGIAPRPSRDRRDFFSCATTILKTILTCFLMHS